MIRLSCCVWNGRCLLQSSRERLWAESYCLWDNWRLVNFLVRKSVAPFFSGLSMQSRSRMFGPDCVSVLDKKWTINFSLSMRFHWPRYCISVELFRFGFFIVISWSMAPRQYWSCSIVQQWSSSTILEPYVFPMHLISRLVLLQLPRFVHIVWCVFSIWRYSYFFGMRWLSVRSMGVSFLVVGVWVERWDFGRGYTVVASYE